MKKIFPALLLGAIAFAACKKGGGIANVEGFWQGTATNNITNTPAFFDVLLRSDNTLRAYQNAADTINADKYEGTYTVDADSVRMSVASVGSLTQFTGGITNATSTQMSGTFRRTAGAYAGTFVLAKQ